MTARYAKISPDVVLQYMRDELDPLMAARVEYAIETDSLAPDVKAVLCGSFKRASRGNTSRYELGGTGCNI